MYFTMAYEGTKNPLLTEGENMVTAVIVTSSTIIERIEKIDPEGV